MHRTTHSDNYHNEPGTNPGKPLLREYTDRAKLIPPSLPSPPPPLPYSATDTGEGERERGGGRGGESSTKTALIANCRHQLQGAQTRGAGGGERLEYADHIFFSLD